MKVKGNRRREAEKTLCDGTFKKETFTVTPPLLTMNQLFRFPMDTEAARQLASVDCAVVNSFNVNISGFSLSVTPVFI